MHQLPSSTVRLLSSSQVITAVVSVVKELVENSLDAFASNIEVRLENFGFDKIEVRDNGIGIKASDTPVMGIRHYTSKICSHEDLETLQTYGFRGEALGSICSIAEVHIATKTANDSISTLYSLDNNGHVVFQKPSHLGQGTTVSVMKLFKNLPVRKQYYSTAKKCKEELKKIQNLLINFGLIKPDIRIVLVHNKEVLWQKNKVSDHKMALISVLGTTVMNAMKPIQHHCKDPELLINGYLPIPEADRMLTSVHGPEKSFIFINQRPVHHKDILKVVRMYYNQNKDSSRCYPIFFLNIVVPASSVDVNVTPDKTQVLLHNKDLVLEAVENVLKSVYPDPVTMSIHKPDAQPDYMHSSSAEKHNIMNTKNEDGEKLNVSSLSQNSNNCESEMQSHVYLEHQLSSHNKSLKTDLEQVAGKESSAVHNLSSSSDQSEYTFKGNQKHVEIGPYAVTQTSEIQAMKNTMSTANLTITNDSWSRGNAFRNSTEIDIQPVTVLCPSAVSHGGEKSNETALDKSCNVKKDQKTTNFITEKYGFVTAYDLMNNQVIRKHVSAIDIFTQEHRDKFLNDSPKVPLDEVPSVILELWDKLSEEDKFRYEEKAAKDMQRYKMHTVKATKETVQMAKVSGKKIKLTLDKTPAQKIKLQAPMSNQQILNKLFYSQVEKKVEEPANKTIKIDFSLYNLKKQLYKLGRKEIDFEEITLMSKLNLPGAWIAASKNGIALLNPYRVEEALLYKRLVENHKIPVEKLDVPIVLTDRLIGGSEYFTALLNMQKDTPGLNGHTYFSDVRLTNNGFHIKMIPGSSTFVNHVEIESMNRNMPFYGISDLKEVISFVMNKKTNLCECRPLKVLNYLEIHV
ncbi:PMS1 protein homolog 1 isoform X2 [Hyla sarda]|uniref:PMS1 protein homolog 1 isoform X2 n=1 Tax=Hyla sarda TaxID=327740 RepID=UPI0024C2682E|nr:PMS1 protein homolog 1 isoform X2 [Hyla sarda]